MKLIRIFAAALAITAATTISVNATNSAFSNTEEIVVNVEPQKTEITPSELPDAVKDAIMEGEYAQWNIAKAYKITYSEDDGKVEYEVHFSNEEEQKQIEVYDEEGELVED